MTKPTMQEFAQNSYLSGGNAAYIEQMYELFIKDPSSVDANWRKYFESLPGNGLGATDISHADIRDHFKQITRQPVTVAPVNSDVAHVAKQTAVIELIDAYRVHGHLAAKIDPLGATRPEVQDLELTFHGLSNSDLNTQFRAPDLMNEPQSTLAAILEKLQKTYCGSIGAEYMYITKPDEVTWWKRKLEYGITNLNYSAERKLEILQQLTEADGLEKYLGSRYVGQKRFSLEGGDSFIPMMNTLINDGGAQGVEEFVIGMAHRGRLNVLINICGQSPTELFQEFEGTRELGLTSGDVKYHLGFSSDVQTPGGPVHLSLAFNPSHLEVISAVVMGSVRARIDRHKNKADVVAIVVHGDSAIAGQGIVMETFNMAHTNAYGIGGTVHIVINNQVGFTTHRADDTRSSLYCTDIAKMIEAPVLHVNGNDPEAVVFASQCAIEYRNTFHKDVVIDLVCFRRHGHNEADEPRATQPMMYQTIDKMPTPRELYAAQLIEQGVCDQAKVDQLFGDYRDRLDQGKQIVNTIKGTGHELASVWTKYLHQDWSVAADTTVDKDYAQKLAQKLYTLPENLNVQRQVAAVMKGRLKMASGEVPMDWGFAENMAYATLLDEGYSVRMSGQDVRRGTFAHRHAAIHDQETGDTYTPLYDFATGEASFQIYDSLLSEEGVLGFEYGYSKTAPHGLVIWEAQFGDFANGAQVIIDQFLSSAWSKWERLSGLVMLLPHGYEGMGPEHSSARLERYMQLCAEQNLQVCVPSTPAQVFHMLRRQVIRPYRKPLIVMSPKSLLRHKLATSSWDDLCHAQFQNLIPEIDVLDEDKVRKVVLCSGKVYYDLLERRRENNIDDIAIVRVEQLYPFPYEEAKAQLRRYKNAKEVVWCQEEPKNQGAWFISHHRLIKCLTEAQTLTYAGRPASAAASVGYSSLHKQQQEKLVSDALA